MPDTLVIGAGPFGLALAAHLKNQGIEHLVIGKPMEFWEKHMPEGMYLRSGCDWHLDVNNTNTIDAFAKTQQHTIKEVEPISLNFYLKYAHWFIGQTRLNIKRAYVTTLKQAKNGFTATSDDGDSIEAKHVVVATGFKYFTCTPPELAAVLPQGRYSHTCNTNELSQFSSKRVLIIGGRQSAFEWTALLREKHAAEVHVSYRHDTPDFVASDWNWVMDVVNNIALHPSWFRELDQESKEQYRYKLWAEGRLKVEPWLKERVQHDNITLHPHTQVERTTITNDNAIKIYLNNGASFEVDHIITATGYKVETKQLPFLHADLLASLECSNGFPQLDTHFQSNVPGLFFTSFMAGQDFGPFFGFTIGVRAAAQLVAQGLKT